MSRHRFTDTQARVYVDRALLVNPGDVVDWPDGAPGDDQWEQVDDDTPTAAELAAEAERAEQERRAAEDAARDAGTDEGAGTDETAATPPATPKAKARSATTPKE